MLPPPELIAKASFRTTPSVLKPNGKRTSVSIEAIFRDVLATAAAAANLTLQEYLWQIADRYNDGQTHGLSAILRVVAMQLAAQAILRR